MKADALQSNFDHLTHTTEHVKLTLRLYSLAPQQGDLLERNDDVHIKETEEY